MLARGGARIAGSGTQHHAASPSMWRRVRERLLARSIVGRGGGCLVTRGCLEEEEDAWRSSMMLRGVGGCLEEQHDAWRPADTHLFTCPAAKVTAASHGGSHVAPPPSPVPPLPLHVPPLPLHVPRPASQAALHSPAGSGLAAGLPGPHPPCRCVRAANGEIPAGLPSPLLSSCGHATVPNPPPPFPPGHAGNPGESNALSPTGQPAPHRRVMKRNFFPTRKHRRHWRAGSGPALPLFRSPVEM
jgi:hypothetical protein